MTYSNPTEYHSPESVRFYSEIATSALDHAKNYVRATPGARALDLGSGTGISTSVFSGHWSDFEWTACDTAPAMLEYSRSILPSAIRLALAHTDFEGNLELPFENQSFDLVTSSFALHWMLGSTSATNDSAIREIERVLRPGGIFLASLPATARGRSSLSKLTYSQTRRREKPQILRLWSLGLNERRLGYLSQLFGDQGMTEIAQPKHFQYLETFEDRPQWLRALKSRGALAAMGIEESALEQTGAVAPIQEPWTWWCQIWTKPIKKIQ